ncbi:MAG TPA: methyltransferase domain-containing protein [Novosphingobium sp.]|nr:methyltransferase domain-containing protein [Novosphingobium sp.]
MKRLVLISAALTTVLAAPLAAAPKDYAPAIAAAGRAEANRKLDESRNPTAVLDFAGYKRGDVIADFMAGGGYYTELLSQVVGPRGRVYATEPSVFYDAKVWEPLTKSHSNVATLVQPVAAMQLAPGSVDSVFAHLVYHDLYWESEKYKFARVEPAAIAANWFAALKPGGTVVIVDHVGPAGDTRALVEKFHRIDPAQVKADMAAAGFELVAESGVLHRSDDPHTAGVFDPSVRGKTDRFMLKFRKPA